MAKTSFAVNDLYKLKQQIAHNLNVL